MSRTAAATGLAGHSSLSRRFGIFALVVCLALLTLFALDTARERSMAVDTARRSSANLAESLAQQAADTFDSASGALDALAVRFARDGTSASARIRLQDTMRSLIATMPRIHSLIIFDRNAHLVVSNFADRDQRLPTVNDRPFFAYHRNHRSLDIHISGPAQSRRDHSWVLFVTRRLEDRDGRFVGVAVAPIALSYFASSYAKVDMGSGGVIAMFGNDGTVMMRRPAYAIGERLRGAHLFSSPNAGLAAGSYLATSPIDGTFRLHAFRRLGRYPIVVLVALAEREYLADWAANVRANAMVLALVVGMIAILAVALNAQIRQRRSAEEQLARLAMFDALTGIANRRCFDEVLEREWRYAVRTRTALALLMIDVDLFKAYNDRYGHQAGDTALVRIAEAIADEVRRPGDLAARYGGEEFVVILRETDVASARTVAERIRTAVAALRLPHDDSVDEYVSVSIGLSAIVPVRNSAGTSLIEAADMALYAAKRDGRNRIAVVAESVAGDVTGAGA